MRYLCGLDVELMNLNNFGMISSLMVSKFNVLFGINRCTFGVSDNSDNVFVEVMAHSSCIHGISNGTMY